MNIYIYIWYYELLRWRKPIHIFTLVAQRLRHWPLMREVVGLSPVISKDFLHFLFLFGIFNVQTDLWKLKFMGFMITSCLIQNITAKPIIASVLINTQYSLTLIRIFLVMRNQNKHKNMETTIDKIFLKLRYVFAVFKNVCKRKIWMWPDSMSRPSYYKPAF